LPFAIPRGVVVPVDYVDVRLQPGLHPYTREHEAAIADDWLQEKAANPSLYDGEVILLSELSYRAGGLVGTCHISRFSTFLYWRKNREKSAAEHAFAHAALVSSDNALVAIRMGPQTANAGRVYFAAGSFEPTDFRDGLVDIEANMKREVGEETGIDLDEATRVEDYHLFSERGATVIFRRYHFDRTAEDMAKTISDFVATEAEPEIVGPVIIRSADSMPEGTMPHMAAIVRWHFSTSG
jgi:8-oxo-dGTP pyrophosphatase MutT (NUDIX family)